MPEVRRIKLSKRRKKMDGVGDHTVMDNIKDAKTVAKSAKSGNIDQALKEFNLSDEQNKIVKQLILLNEGRLTPIALRAHLSIGYGKCAQIVENLLRQGLISPPRKNEKIKYLAHRQQGWRQNS